jgi:parallel beta-helix repeat protein
MMKRIFIGSILMLLLSAMLAFAFAIQPVKTGSTIITVPDDYPTIQAAINAASPGDMIFVKAGTCNENVVVNKTVSLVGEAPATTVIDGGGTSDVVRVTANNVIIKNFKIRNSGKYYAPPDSGIRVDASYCNITGNVIIENSVGIYLEKSSYNSIDSNNITNKYDGIILHESSRNSIRGNNITAHEYLGVALSWLSSNNVISGNNMTDNGRGISIADSRDNIVSGNNIVATTLKAGMDAISLLASSNIIISENIITNHWASIELSYSLNCTIYENTMNGNTYNFGVWGSTLSHFLHSIDVSNLVDGKPVYYLINQKDLMINPSTYPEIGYLALINSTNIQVEGLMLTGNWHSLLLAYTNNSKITYNTITGARNDGGVDLYRSSNNKIYGNNITDNYCGISLESSSNNIISGNNITNNSYGIGLDKSSNNAIFHNNFIDNAEQVYSYDSVNVWDDGYPSGGNFWSDYPGEDTNNDGIGDAPYAVDANNTDRYPLMAPISVFDAGVWNGIAYNVDVVSNSTVSEFQFNPSEGALLRFNVTGDDGTFCFCRVTIPKSLLWVEDGWTIHVGGEAMTNFTILSDENYTYLYFTYNHSTKTILIQGTHVIPEFTSVTILPLFMIAALFAIMVSRRKGFKHQTSHQQ